MQILALHGFTGRGSDFHGLAQTLGGEWHCPDLPGHGPKPQLDCSPKSTLQFLDNQHIGINAPSNILVGYSMGARAALLYATQKPDSCRALILISPNPGIEDASQRTARREADDMLAQSIESDSIPTFLHRWQETPLIRAQKKLPKDTLIAMQNSRMQHTKKGLANSLRQFGQGSVPNLWPKLDKLKMPVCVITGELDEKYSEIGRRMKDELQESCQHIKMPSLSHAPHFEAREDFCAIVANFLSEI